MCLDVTLPASPTLGFGLSIAPPEPSAIDFDAELCCKFQFEIPLPPIPLPPFAFNAAATLLIKNALAAVQTYIDALPLDCPLNS